MSKLISFLPRQSFSSELSPQSSSPSHFHDDLMHFSPFEQANSSDLQVIVIVGVTEKEGNANIYFLHCYKSGLQVKNYEFSNIVVLKDM